MPQRNAAVGCAISSKTSIRWCGVIVDSAAIFFTALLHSAGFFVLAVSYSVLITCRMPLLLIVVPYVISGAILWFIVHQCAPIGSTISLWEVIGVIFLLGVAQSVWQGVLAPASSPWLLDTLIHFAVLALLLFGMIRLTFLNALKAAAMYVTLFLGISVVIHTVTGK